MLKEEIEALGINEQNLTNDGWSSVVVQTYAIHSNAEQKENPDKRIVSVCKFITTDEECTIDYVNLSNESEKQEFLKDIRDSQERLKILAELLHQQELEVEKYGYIKTACCYPEIESLK